MNLLNLCFGFLFCVFPFTFCLEPISTGVFLGGTALAAIYGTTNFMKCVLYECCNEEKEKIVAKNSIKYDFADDLRADFATKLHGQHIASSLVSKAIIKHMADKDPRKALVFSFHGWTGGGKNFVSYLIARNIFEKGMKSAFVHVITATERFPDPNKSLQYKLELIDFVKENLEQCGRQLFIFDEVDKFPEGVIDGLSPFLSFSMDSKDQQKAIYIFLSNTGGGEIARIAYNFYMNGLKREDISLQDIESIIDLYAFNEDGGLRRTSIMQKKLIDFFIPFLPLEKQHVQSCIVDYFHDRYNITKKVNDKLVIEIANEMEYFPADAKIYSKSGCKKVARKVDMKVD